MIGRFFRNMAAFDAGWLVGVLTGGLSVAAFMLAANVARSVLKALL